MLFVGTKPHNVVDVTSPFKSGELPTRELFALKEQRNYPEQLVSFIGATMLYFELFLAVFEMILELFLLLSRALVGMDYHVVATVESGRFKKGSALFFIQVYKLHNFLLCFNDLASSHQVE